MELEKGLPLEVYVIFNSSRRFSDEGSVEVDVGTVGSIETRTGRN